MNNYWSLRSEKHSKQRLIEWVNIPPRKLTWPAVKSPVFLGDTSSNGGFSIDMLAFGVVSYLMTCLSIGLNMIRYL